MGKIYLTVFAILATFSPSTASTSINFGDELTTPVDSLSESYIIVADYNEDENMGDYSLSLTLLNNSVADQSTIYTTDLIANLTHRLRLMLMVYERED